MRRLVTAARAHRMRRRRICKYVVFFFFLCSQVWRKFTVSFFAINPHTQQQHENKWQPGLNGSASRCNTLLCSFCLYVSSPRIPSKRYTLIPRMFFYFALALCKGHTDPHTGPPCFPQFTPRPVGPPSTPLRFPPLHLDLLSQDQFLPGFCVYATDQCYGEND